MIHRGLVSLSTKPRLARETKHYLYFHLVACKYLLEMLPVRKRALVGFYELVNLQLKGYDFVVLEKYQSHLHRTMKKMDFNVTKAWSAPHRDLLVENLADRSTAVEHSHQIKMYERNIQMKEATVTKLPILIDYIHMTMPPGVSFNIRRHTPEDDDRVHFKDSVLEKLREDLQELQDTPLIGA